MNSLDELIEVYMRDVDTTLLEASLHRSVEERLRALEQFGEFVESARIALESPLDAVL